MSGSSFWKDQYGPTGKGVAVGFALGIAAIGIAVGTPAVTCSGCGGATGEHSVYVIAVEDQINVTWDSTVVHVKTDPQASNEDRYCVVDPAVRKQLDQAVVDRRRVVVHYRNDLVMWRWECNGGDSIIVSVDQEAERSP